MPQRSAQRYGNTRNAFRNLALADQYFATEPALRGCGKLVAWLSAAELPLCNRAASNRLLPDYDGGTDANSTD
jgi:hypothetical protein